MSKRLFSWIALAALAAALVVIGYWLLFSFFMIYDDEGYVLLSLKNFSLHGALYDRVYTQYGPFPYLFYDALHRLLGFAFTNTTGRWITLANWFGASTVCAILVGRQTRSMVWGAFTLAGVYTYLWVMVREPIHPGGLLAILVALGTWLGAEAWSTGRYSRFAWLTALTGAALAFTKINVGIFFLGATFAWLAVNTAPPRAARALTWLVAIGCAVMPFGLMHALLDTPWVRLFALVFVCASIGALLGARLVAVPVVTPRTWMTFAGTLFGGLVLLAALTLVRGTTLHGLLDGMVLEPMKHPSVYFFAVGWQPGARVLALVSLGFAVWSLQSGWLMSNSGRTLIALARLLVTALFLCTPLQFTQVSLADWASSYGIALAWIFVVPLHDDREGAAVRAWVALVLVFQLLHAYPVAGSQLNWGTYLWVPLLALGMHDAVTLLRARLGAWGLIATRIGAVIIIAVTLVMVRQLARVGWGRYDGPPELGIPGAERLHLGPDYTYVLRILNQNLRLHADLLFSLPGLYSANLWTDLPTPTLANATHWFSLLTETQQQEIIQQMAASPRAVLLVQGGLLDYLNRNGFEARGPLYEWLMAHFEKSFALDTYEFWVRQGRQIAPLSTARFVTPVGDERGVTLTMAAPGRAVARIDLCDFYAPDQPLAKFTSANAAVTVEPIDLANKSLGPAQPSAFPITFTGYARISLHYHKTGVWIAVGQALLVLRDSTGAVVGEARVLD